MNHPPTALVGFGTGLRAPDFRLSMNHPPTALVGFGTGDDCQMALPHKVKTYFREQVAMILAGRYWNCLLSAGTIAELLLEDGRSPWIGSLRKVEVRGPD